MLLKCELEWNSAIDDGIVQWHRHLHACIPARGGHFEYSLTQISQNIINCDKLS